MVWRRPNANEEHGDRPDIIGRWVTGLLARGADEPPHLPWPAIPTHFRLVLYTTLPGSYQPIKLAEWELSPQAGEGRRAGRGRGGRLEEEEVRRVAAHHPAGSLWRRGQGEAWPKMEWQDALEDRGSDSSGGGEVRSAPQ